MSTKLTLLELLSEREGQFFSGQELADRLGLSRNSIWKAANKLREQGYSIESMAGTGYRLKNTEDIISEDYLRENISYPCKITVLEKTVSTNNDAKALEVWDTPCIIVADEQTGGRGRLGRSFFSPAGKGLYMSIAFRPDFQLDRAMLTTTMSAVAVCRAIEKVSGLHPKIKWVNDIFLNDKKICGILTEAESNFENGMIDKIIVGIGVNCFESFFPEEINEIATYIQNPLRNFSRSELCAAIVNEFFNLMNNFNKTTMIREYKSKSFILGEKIMIYNRAVARTLGRPAEREADGIKARAIDIDENGGLVVEFLEGRRSREMDTLTTGEISIRKI